MNTREQIIKLYLGCDVMCDMTEYYGRDYKGIGVNLDKVKAHYQSINRNRAELTSGQINQWVGVKFYGANGLEFYNSFNEYCNIFTQHVHPENCQLILKRLSSMSEEENKIFVEETKVDSVLTGTNYVWQKCLNEFLWLIEHGYALSDSWFEPQNGQPAIAIEEGK